MRHVRQLRGAAGVLANDDARRRRRQGRRPENYERRRPQIGKGKNHEVIDVSLAEPFHSRSDVKDEKR